jgi:hypothetical protein
MSEEIVVQSIQRWAMKTEVFGRPSIMSDYLVKSVDQKPVKDGASKFHNLHVIFLKLHQLFSTRLSYFG